MKANQEAVTCEGFIFNPATGKHDERVIHIARNRREANDWIQFVRGYMRAPRIVPAEVKS